MKTKQIKCLLKQAIYENTPDLLDSISKVPIVKKEVFNMNTNLEKKSYKKFIIIPAITSLAICCLTIFTLYFVENQVETLLSLDVNPSIELVLNKQEKVIKCNAKNDDAKKIISDMNLKNVEADIALNAIIGSLYKNGYLEKDTKENDILLSIDNKDKTKTNDLEKKYTKVVKNTLKENNTSGIILSQKDISNDEIKILSEKYNISEGKALLIEKILLKSTNSNFEQLASMNIKELVNHINNNNLKVDDVETDDIDDDSDDILDELNEIEENRQDNIKEEQDKQEDIIKDKQEIEKENQEKAQEKLKEEKEKEAERIKKEAERIKEEQDKVKEKNDKEQEKLREEQEKLNEEQNQE